MLQRLQALDSCVVSDALDRLGLHGAALGIGRLWPCPRVAGRLLTVALAPVEDVSAKPVTHLGARAIEAAGPEHVIAVANGGRLQMAAWGGLLSRAARQRGVRGVVVDGSCRDVDEAIELRFPLFARGAVPRTARGRVTEVATGAPVEIAGTVVAEGDLVIADASGVVFIPAGRATAVLDAAEALARREAELASALERGAAVTEVLGGDYERMLQATTDDGRASRLS
ncbi:MAG TPA: RraA family protein [Solirubrobacteraceae bacterium]|nr:RraA family protein [Solirubrobacteraceae bacterium]